MHDRHFVIRDLILASVIPFERREKVFSKISTVSDAETIAICPRM